mmetsp:Transcript_31267/g.93326  ORF Transcript_31267/g.93326 Transcript_31267/m.93326 type:complete len:256 (+) Transcript_31267:109-876(+)
MTAWAHKQFQTKNSGRLASSTSDECGRMPVAYPCFTLFRALPFCGFAVAACPSRLSLTAFNAAAGCAPLPRGTTLPRGAPLPRCAALAAASGFLRSFSSAQRSVAAALSPSAAPSCLLAASATPSTPQRTNAASTLSPWLPAHCATRPSSPSRHNVVAHARADGGASGSAADSSRRRSARLAYQCVITCSCCGAGPAAAASPLRLPSEADAVAASCSSLPRRSRAATERCVADTPSGHISASRPPAPPRATSART